LYYFIILFINIRRKTVLSQARWYLAKFIIYLLIFFTKNFFLGVFRVLFDSISMVFIFYEIVNLPMAIAFSDIIVISSFQNSLNFYIIIHFCCDIVLNFVTAFYKKGKLIFNQKLIIQNYLITWFLLDLASTLPFD